MYCDVILCLLGRGGYMLSLTISVLESVFVLRDVCVCVCEFCVYSEYFVAHLCVVS